MAFKSGTLGTADVGAGTNTTVYTTPSVAGGGVDTTATINICVANRNASPIKVRIAIGSATPAGAHYIDYDTVIAANEPYERTKKVTKPGDVVVVYSDTANVSARVEGFEQAG